MKCLFSLIAVPALIGLQMPTAAAESDLAAPMSPLLVGLVPATAATQTAPRHAQNVAPAAATPAPTRQAATANDDEELPGIGDGSGESPSAKPVTIPDPIESVNRAFFVFNDKVYFWALKPVATGYEKVLPQVARRSIKNAFSNIRTPVRFVNSLLQGEGTAAWTELERLLINSTVGVLGLGDPAKNRWAIEKHEADLGQTLGRFGQGTSIYFVCPFLGPMNVRDGIGYVGDLFLDPLTYVLPNIYCDVAVKAGETVNATSLRLGDYEDFKKASLDPYVAMRDAYTQYRDNFVKGTKNTRPADPLHAD